MNRRLFLGASLATTAASPAQEFRFPGKRPMIVHNDFPEDLESLPEYLSSWITPNDAFFVRQHLPRPRTSAETHKIEVGGLAANKLTLSIADLRKLPQVSVPAVLECAGNGRSYYRPKMPGLQWTKGAIGNAEWRGPRLADVLAKAGASSKAVYADFDGLDVGVGKTPDFIRSIPMRKLQHPSTILALDMNGVALPDLHGGPVRLVVPGWDGASWVKWVSRIELVDKMHAGFFMNPAYRYPKNPVAPGTAAKPEDLDVLEGMAVKSFFARPADQAKVQLGAPVTLTGPAWAGEHNVVRVEVSTDGGATWKTASLSSQGREFSWRIWKTEWRPAKPGFYTLCCRAADTAGRIQPIEPAWNPSGYLWNAVDRIGVLVEG
ncbi:MAG: sulfite oxidase [Bryobacterales bacterium]|nr:sulfite oxidase [Bryobacterales bacterium]